MPSMVDIPSDPKKVRARLRGYERKLRPERGGFIDDGAGKRYFLVGLYLVLDDLDGAMESMRWFERTFPDDSRDEAQLLSWALALHRAGHEEAAKERLRQCMLENRYVLPRLLGRTFDGLEVSKVEDGYKLMHLDHSIPVAFFDLWTDAEKAWAASLYDTRLWSGMRERALDIERMLEDMPRSEERSMLCGELAAMRYGREERRR